MLSARTPLQPETGKKVGEYVFIYGEVIGRGNFARVYRGVHLPTGQAVAIKAISLDALKCKRLEALVFEEIKVLQMMDHPNVLRLREALLSERNCYIVTELCPGGNLEERLRRGPMGAAEIAGVVLQLVEGLRYLRAMGVVHRDFKTANIFLSNGLVKIADFGLAKAYKERFHDIDIGSPHYMSPEALILNVYSEKTDIWALGVVLYEMTHARTPFAHCRNDQEIKNCVVRPLPDAAFRNDLPPCFRMLIGKLMEVDEGRRPTVAELIKDPLLEGIREIVRAKQGKEGKRKFSFCEKTPLGTLFHKKTEASLQTIALLPPAFKGNQNRTLQLTPSHQLRSNQTLNYRPPQANTMNMPTNQLSVDPRIQRPASNNYCVPSKLERGEQLWDGASTKTNETKQDSEQEERKHQRTNTARSFWK